MSSEEKFQAAIDSLRQDVEGLKTKLYLKDTKMELLLANLAKTEQDLAVMQQQMDDVLLGSIATFAMPEPPEGWLACDGQEVSRQTYARLFGKIGTTFGEGDGEITFNLPDLQGVFVRGWDEEREFGSFQEDQMQGHTHRDGGHSHQGKTSSAGSHQHVENTNEAGTHWHMFSTSFVATGYYQDSIEDEIFLKLPVGSEGHITKGMQEPVNLLMTIKVPILTTSKSAPPVHIPIASAPLLHPPT